MTILDPLILRRADLRGLRALWLPVQWARAITKVRRFSLDYSGRFDIVHAHCMPSVGGVLFARYLSVPLVWHVHEIFGETRVARVIFERLLSRANLILAASRSVKSQLRSEALRNRTRVAHTGAHVPVGIPCAKPFERKVPRIVCVARLNQWKGQEILIRSTQLLRDQNITVQAYLVGDVFRFEHHFRIGLERMASSLKVADRIHFLGQRDDAADQMAQGDVVVVPSTRPEPFGMVVVEGMALGRPVIATDAGGPAEIITNARDGVLVEPGSAVALADALRRLIDDPDWARRLGSRATATALRFTPEAMVLKVLDAYDEVLAAATNSQQGAGRSGGS